ncbi:MBL fold metallo-hydrolase RNA specificity domain-containing protein [Spartinivicinus ruber]|uniref:MBL fold metallo-hydrolase RNA specificity domain-containing protein n=1 Tax=Spartinivicinus ruber TaxID=2683272 RepID=UPI0013D7FA50|nr:MBL fold metallo-hydrolase [Spartinivicinus ruber]
MATIKFIGAAQEVTGSCHFLESSATGKVLLDCGMHQGGDAVDRLQHESFQFDPQQIDAVILSHAHIDHSGLLPKLVHDGFKGPIYCTEATAELLDIMLNDSTNLYQRDLEKENLRRARKGKKPLKPQVVPGDVAKVLKLCKPQPYNKQFAFTDDATVIFHDAGHILGSAIVEIILQEKQQRKTLVFSGDLGKKNTVLMNDPVTLTQADVVLMEGTYGNRDHRSLDNTIDQLRDILQETWEEGGNVFIPAFAVGRTQELLFYLGRLHHEGVLDNWHVYLDSPMAIQVTRIYDRWLHTLDCEGIKPLCSGDQTLLGKFLPKLHLTITPEESMAINNIKSGAIIIAGSGMCTGGRIRHHFKQRIWNKLNRIIFVGFQAYGTLGRILVDGVKHIRLFGEEYVVKARIETLGGFSAHAGQTELVEWISQFKGNPHIMLVHGEPESLDVLSQKLWDEKGIQADIPQRGQSVAF